AEAAASTAGRSASKRSPSEPALTGSQTYRPPARSAASQHHGSPTSKKKVGRSTPFGNRGGLAVDEPAVRRAGGLHHRLGERRMRVDRPGHLGIPALEVARDDELRDQVGRLGADDVTAKQLAVLPFADDLDHAAAVAVDRR